MIFGLKNAPGNFNSFIAFAVPAIFIGNFVVLYLDDFIVNSNYWYQYIYHVHLVLEWLYTERNFVTPGYDLRSFLS